MGNYTLIERLISKIDLCTSIEDLEQCRIDLLGKNGLVTRLFGELKTLPPSECKEVAQKLNTLKAEAVQKIASRATKLEEIAINAFVDQDWCDITLPGKPRGLGLIHPISKTRAEISDILATFGFTQATGPEIEDDWHNFTALNMPEGHPARQMMDTFYIKGNAKLLRTHTSTVQIRAMEGNKPPFRFFSFGRVYRKDLDATHTPMFHQIEAVMVDKEVSLANLKFLLHEIVRRFFGNSTRIRLRPSFFPFTSPSLELDIQQGSSWLEIGGAGIIHPKVLANVEGSWRGLALGMGIERLAMIKYGIKDIRQCFESDLRWLRHYGCSAY